MPSSDLPPPLPSPAALFGSSLFDYHRQRPLYILPPPPGYHHHPHHPQHPPPPPIPFCAGVKRGLPDRPGHPKRPRTAQDDQQEINAARTLASFATASLAAADDDPADRCACQADRRCDRCAYPRAAESWKAGMSKRQQVQIMEAAQILMDIARCGMRVSVA